GRDRDTGSAGRGGDSGAGDRFRLLSAAAGVGTDVVARRARIHRASPVRLRRADERARGVVDGGLGRALGGVRSGRALTAAPEHGGDLSGVADDRTLRSDRDPVAPVGPLRAAGATPGDRPGPAW